MNGVELSELHIDEHTYEPDERTVGTSRTTREQRRVIKRLKSNRFVGPNITPPKKKRK